MKCECGLSYVEGHPDDETLHAKLHREFEDGPELPCLNLLTPVGVASDFAVYEVDGSVPERVRRNLAKVAQVAQRGMSDFPTGYDGTVDHDNQRLFILASAGRGAGMAIVADSDRFWHFKWNGDNAELVSQLASRTKRPKVARVWLANSVRSRGLAQLFLHSISSCLKCSVADLGWEIPFTASGRRLVRRLTPESFWGDGDPYAVHEMLEPGD